MRLDSGGSGPDPQEWSGGPGETPQGLAQTLYKLTVGKILHSVLGCRYYYWHLEGVCRRSGSGTDRSTLAVRLFERAARRESGAIAWHIRMTVPCGEGCLYRKFPSNTKSGASATADYMWIMRSHVWISNFGASRMWWCDRGTSLCMNADFVWRERDSRTCKDAHQVCVKKMSAYVATAVRCCHCSTMFKYIVVVCIILPMLWN